MKNRARGPGSFDAAARQLRSAREARALPEVDMSLLDVVPDVVVLLVPDEVELLGDVAV